jgi:hypothetical protein
MYAKKKCLSNNVLASSNLVNLGLTTTHTQLCGVIDVWRNKF